MYRCRVTTQIPSAERAVLKFRKLIEQDLLEDIAREVPESLVGIEKARWALQHTSGGYVKCSRPEDHRYLQYKDQVYVGDADLEFKAPMNIMPPDGLKYPLEFTNFISKYPEYYPKWNKGIQQKALKHDCRCITSGASWHLNWQECLCPGKTLDEAGAKWEALKEDMKK